MNQSLFDRFNDEEIDLSEFEHIQLSEIERKAAKKRIKAKLKRKRNFKARILGVVASFAIMTFIGLNTNYALADIPIIGGTLENFVSNGRPLKDYTTIIGKSTEDKGMRVTLNEVILDEGQLLISSTFHTDLLEEDLEYNWFSDIKVYVNGSKYELTSGGGGPKQITNSAINYFWAADIEQHELKDIQRMKIVFKDLRRSDSKKVIEGSWSFNFTATSDKLMAERKAIPINKVIKLENEQEIKVNELILTPISTKLNYEMSNVLQDIHFKIEDQNGKTLQETIAQTLSLSNYNRFEALESHVTKLKVIPYISPDIAEGESEDVFSYDEAFEIDLH